MHRPNLSQHFLDEIQQVSNQTVMIRRSKIKGEKMTRPVTRRTASGERYRYVSGAQLTRLPRVRSTKDHDGLVREALGVIQRSQKFTNGREYFRTIVDRLRTLDGSRRSLSTYYNTVAKALSYCEL